MELENMIDEIQGIAQSLERELFDRYGPMISGEPLRVALGYPTMPAFRQALVRRRVPVPVFTIEGRKGKYALVRDVARWLAEQRASATLPRTATTPSKART
ncbi:hypothetical protein ACUHMQ_16145 [Chitinimonas sp. PSY-7]|uniref:hypothetical protein n=1 Tax=Chitinimonas sp. PSY-7 TaxID=3459088 RepID=UPI00403FE860